MFGKSQFILMLCCLLLAVMLSPLAVMAQEPEVVTLEVSSSPLENGTEATVIAPTLVSEQPTLPVPTPEPDSRGFWDRFVALPDWAINGFLLVIGLLCICLVVLAIHAVNSANKTYPAGTGTSLETLFKELNERANQTQTSWDNILLTVVSPLLQSMVTSVKQRETTVTIPPDVAELMLVQAQTAGSAFPSSVHAESSPDSRRVAVPFDQHLPLDARPSSSSTGPATTSRLDDKPGQDS